MSADEFLYWIWRVVLVLIFGVLLVIILSALVPRMEANDLRADLLAARIAHNGGFHESPGVINPSRFTQETADGAFAYPLNTIDSSSQTIRTAVGAAAWVTDQNNTVILEPILYNKNAYALLNPRRERSEIAIDTRALPVLLTDGTPGYLHIEVLYENERGDKSRRDKQHIPTGGGQL